jgi:predicted nucleic acid-binding protein
VNSGLLFPGGPVFVDTNVLVYLRDSTDPEKQASAAEWVGWVWEHRAGRLSTQVLQEYYVTVTQKLDPGMETDHARDDVAALATWNPLAVTSEVMEAAWREQDRWGFSLWDSLIVAAARTLDCRVLLTEDLTHGQDLDGVLVVSPFAASPEGAG